MGPSDHLSLIEAVRHRQKRSIVGQTLWYGALGAGLFLALAGFSGEAHAWAARGFLILIPSVLSMFLIRNKLLSRSAGSTLETAHFIDRQLNGTTRNFTAAVELTESPQDNSSPALRHSFLNQMSVVARGLSAENLVNDTPVRRSRNITLGLLALATLLVGLRFHDWKLGLRSALNLDTANHTEARLDPIAGDITLEYRFPAYTGLEPKIVSGTDGTLSAVEGTEVLFRAKADRDVFRAFLETHQSPQQIPLEVVASRELTGTLRVKSDGWYRLIFKNRFKATVAVGPRVSIHAEKDKTPQVRILMPTAELEVNPNQKVILQFEASDDYGLSSLKLRYQRGGEGEPQSIPMPADAHSQRNVKSRFTWDLSTLSLTPGGRVSYFFEAQDNNTLGGVQTSHSSTHILKVYNPMAHREMALEKFERLWRTLLAQLADRLEETPATFQIADTSGLNLVNEFQSLAHSLSQQRDVPKALYAAVVASHSRLDASLRSVLENRPPAGRSPAPLASALARDVHELERAALYLESLSDREKIQELKQMAGELSQDRRRLTSMLEKHPKSNQEILADLQKFRTHISELMKKMSSLAKGIRDEHLNAEALQALSKENDFNNALAAVEKMVGAGKTEEAMAKLQALSMQMDQMLTALEKSDRQFERQQFPELQEKYGQFLKSVSDLKTSQEKLSLDTKRLRDTYKDKLKQETRRAGLELKAALLKEVEKAKSEYQKVSSQNARTNKSLEEAKTSLETVQQSLGVNDFDLAAEASRKASAAGIALSVQADEQRHLDEIFQNSEQVQKKSRANAIAMKKTSESVTDVRRQIEQLFPPPGARMSEADKTQLKSMSKEQKRLEQRAEGLKQQMDALGELAPLFDNSAGQQMKRVGEKMGQASAQMNARDPGRGYSEQRGALEQLDDFSERLKQSQSGGVSGGMPLVMAPSGELQGDSPGNGQSGRSRPEKVEIPEEEAAAAPREFRQNLLDAMKQPAPEKYRDQVKRYYQELVR